MRPAFGSMCSAPVERVHAGHSHSPTACVIAPLTSRTWEDVADNRFRFGVTSLPAYWHDRGGLRSGSGKSRRLKGSSGPWPDSSRAIAQSRIMTRPSPSAAGEPSDKALATRYEVPAAQLRSPEIEPGPRSEGQGARQIIGCHVVSASRRYPCSHRAAPPPTAGRPASPRQLPTPDV